VADELSPVTATAETMLTAAGSRVRENCERLQ